MYFKWADRVLEMYVTGIFYYRVINTTLRLMKPVEQFKNYSYAFFETYYAIKHYHKEKKKNKIEKGIYYRGAKCFRQRDLSYLMSKEAEGDFIEMFGFLSTSKNKLKAK